MATNFDYASLLPGELESTLKALTKVYKDNSNQLSNAYLHTVLPGVYTNARMLYQETLLPLLINDIVS